MNNRISLFVSSSSNEWLYNGDNIFIVGSNSYRFEFYTIISIISPKAHLQNNRPDFWNT